ncbi:MAG: VWA domain-containing protein [Terracidiphilus sp.]
MISWLSLTAAAQQPFNSAAAAGGKDRRLELDVVVTDKSGKPVEGLQEQEFTVLDNKQPSKILSFAAPSAAAAGSNADAGAEIFLVLDEVNTTFQKVWYERDGVKKFLAQNQGKLAYPVSLAFLTETGMQVQTHPSRDGNALIAALDQQEAHLRSSAVSAGLYGAEDRLRISLDALTSFAEQEEARPQRKLAIWVSPGWPLLNRSPHSLIPSQKQRIFNSAVRFSDALRQARMTMYSIDPLGAAGAGSTQSSEYQTFLKGLTGTERAEIGDLALQTVAMQSGGLAIFGNESIASSIDRCAAEFNSFYRLTIEARPADGANEYHELEVKLGTKGLTARTRTGYYAQP